MYKYESKKFYKRFVERTEENVCANLRRFWDFVRKNNKNSIPKIVTLNNQSSNSDADTANLFSNHFHSVYSNNRSFPVVPTLPSPHLYFNFPSNCYFRPDDVEEGLALLNNTKSIGPDDLSGVFICSLRSVMLFSLYLAFCKISQRRCFSGNA